MYSYNLIYENYWVFDDNTKQINTRFSKKLSPFPPLEVDEDLLERVDVE